MMLGKLPVSGRPTYMDDSRARVYFACSRCGCGWTLDNGFMDDLDLLLLLLCCCFTSTVNI